MNPILKEFAKFGVKELAAYGVYKCARNRCSEEEARALTYMLKGIHSMCSEANNTGENYSGIKTVSNAISFLRY